MYYYRIYGMRLAADLEFLQLLEDRTQEIRLTEEKTPKCEMQKDKKDSNTVTTVTITEGEAAMQIPPHPSEQQYDFGAQVSWLENKTCYLLVEDGCRITYQRKAGAREMYLRSYLLGWGISMLSHQRGEPAIHCSAVCDGEGAVLLCGESGSGKSTVTAGLLERGYRLMADDMALVEYRGEQGAWVKAAFPYQKLCRDAAMRSGRPVEELLYIDEDKDKFLVPCKEIFEENPQRIKAMIYLCKTSREEVLMRKLQGLESFHACVGNLFLRHLLKEKKYEPFIGERCLKIASCVPIYVIGRPEGRDTLKEVENRVLQVLGH